jgi:hypothetical protein
MLKPGTHAPPFTLPDQDATPVTLSGLLESEPLILYFRPEPDLVPQPHDARRAERRHRHDEH